MAVCHCRIAFDTPAGSTEWIQQRNLAAKHFRDAHQLALAAAHERLLKELARDAAAWGFTPTEMSWETQPEAQARKHT